VAPMSEQRGLVRSEPSGKRVRIFLGGEKIVDSDDALYVWESPWYPQYYLPMADVVEGALLPSPTTSHSPSRGTADHFTVRGGGREAPDAAWSYGDSQLPELRNRVRFDFDSMDAWFEEDEEIFVHPRDPATRVQILPSSRRVTIELDGITVADSSHPTLLYETHMPRRTYIPKVDVRMDLLTPTSSTTRCPYKGTARYWSLPGNDDVAWSYPTPLGESAQIAGLVAFYDERVDVTVDGVRQVRPSRPRPG
jgi:uncharacterized protein (DUF427 family)